jgi:hypothetical protein
MLNLSPSDTLSREINGHLGSIETCLKLKQMNILPGCPVMTLLSALPGMPQEVIDRLRIRAVAKVIANHGYTKHDFANELAATLKGNGGNWIELIYDNKVVGDLIPLHHLRTNLYAAIYHHNLKTTAEPLFAFRNTLLFVDEINACVTALKDIGVQQSPCEVHTTDRAVYKAAKALVNGADTLDVEYQIKKVKPRFFVS